jgi:hypothetical protein
MEQQLSSAWASLMSGAEGDAVAFCDVLVGALGHADSVSGRIISDAEVEFVVGGETTRIQVNAARGRFRVVCARLAVLFGGEDQVPPILYGGRLSRNVGREKVLAELEFKNSQDGWFSIRRSGQR